MSTIKVDNLQTTGGAGLYPSKVWVNFQGDGTVTIRDDGNVSSITDNNTGDHTINFTTAMSDSNYAPVAAGSDADSNVIETLTVVSPHSNATGSVDILTGYPANNTTGFIRNLHNVNVAIIG